MVGSRGWVPRFGPKVHSCASMRGPEVGAEGWVSKVGPHWESQGWNTKLDPKTESNHLDQKVGSKGWVQMSQDCVARMGPNT